MAETTTIDVASLTALAVDVLRGAGAQPDHAEATSAVLVEADMMGLATHGVLRLLVYTDRLRSGGIDPGAQIAVERRAPCLGLVDGANGLGPAVGRIALDAATEMARETGLAYVGCRNSNHFGALAPYGLWACDAELVMIAGTNASTTMAPFGGREARMGNNPIAVAAPCSDGPHVILDMAMSVAARGKVRAARDQGKPIPEGWAIDAAGRPTTDPVAALDGLLLPFGGHKGSGLSLAVDILSGVLPGARFLTDVVSWVDRPQDPSGVGHFFLLIDPNRLLGPDAYGRAMERFRTIVQSTPPADPDAPVQLPGQREQERRAASLETGIVIASDVLKSIRDLPRHSDA